MASINDFFNRGLHRLHTGQPESQGGSFTSAYSLYKLVDTMDRDLVPSSWKTAEVQLWTGSIQYRYRDPVAIVTYLMRQRTFVNHMFYSPVQEFDTAGERIYSEMHTADWWWQTQVSRPNPLTETFRLLISYTGPSPPRRNSCPYNPDLRRDPSDELLWR